MKPRSEFKVKKNGELETDCRSCKAERKRARDAMIDEKKGTMQPGERWCVWSLHKSPLSNFATDANGNPHSICKTCRANMSWNNKTH